MGGTHVEQEASTCKLPFFEPNPNTHAARSSIAHPQLRDLLICPTQAHHVQTVSDYGVDAHVFGQYTMRLMDSATSFLPNCLVSGCGYVASGGGAADLLIRSSDVHSRWELKVITGQSIVNSVHFFQPSQRCNPQILVCNNDQTITQYDLSNVSSIQDAASGSLSADPDHRSNRGVRGREENYVRGDGDNPFDTSTTDEKPVLSHKTSIFLPVPVNHCSVSPDSKSMVAVGDSNEVFLYDCQNTRQSNEPSIGDWRLGPRKITLPGVSPHIGSFSTSWNQHGDKFAVASEGEVVVVYDMKMLGKPLLVKRSFQRGRPGGARVVKFSPAGPNELLAFTEHQLYVHVLDARTFDPEHEELLKVPTPTPGMTTFPERIERGSIRRNVSATNPARPPSLLGRPRVVYDEDEPLNSSRRTPELNAQLTRGNALRPTTTEPMELGHFGGEDYALTYAEATFELARRGFGSPPEPALLDRIWGELQDESNNEDNNQSTWIRRPGSQPVGAGDSNNEDNNQSTWIRRPGNQRIGAGNDSNNEDNNQTTWTIRDLGSSRGGRFNRPDDWAAGPPFPTELYDDEACLENEGETAPQQPRQIGSTSRSASTGARLSWGTPTNSTSLGNRAVQVYGSSIRVLSNPENERSTNRNNNNNNHNNLPSTSTGTGTGATQHRGPTTSTIANIHSRLINNRLGRNAGIFQQTELWGDESTNSTTGIRNSNSIPNFAPFSGVGVRSGMWDDLIGLSWSPDGRWLVSGTEVNLVEWKVKSSSRSAFGDTRLC